MPRWIKRWEVKSLTRAGLSYKVSQAVACCCSK